MQLKSLKELSKGRLLDSFEMFFFAALTTLGVLPHFADALSSFDRVITAGVLGVVWFFIF